MKKTGDQGLREADNRTRQIRAEDKIRDREIKKFSGENSNEKKK
jgi:hypothetical protein